jgi:hypothetical protein
MSSGYKEAVMYVIRTGTGLVTSLFPSTRWGSFTVGAAAAAFGAALLRPLLVTAVRTGYSVASVASDALDQARAEAASIKAEAATRQPEVASDLAAEVRKLRAEVAALKATPPPASTRS